jgi:RimJ/RimL family protein N-acetyltransferase
MPSRDLVAGFRTVARRLRDRDLRSLWFTALSFARIYRRLILLERSLGTVPPVSFAASFRVAALEDNEVGAYLAFRRDQDAATIRSRLSQGHRCFAVWHQEQIVHAAWAATGRAPIEYLTRDLTLDSGEVFVFDAYTEPAFRGQGASPVRALVLGHHFRTHGYQRVLTAVHPENTVGFRPLEKLATRRVGVIGYLGIGPWRWHFCHRRR